MLRTVGDLRLLLVTKQKAESALALKKFKVKPGSFADISPQISYTPIRPPSSCRPVVNVLEFLSLRIGYAERMLVAVTAVNLYIQVYNLARNIYLNIHVYVMISYDILT